MGGPASGVGEGLVASGAIFQLCLCSACSLALGSSLLIRAQAMGACGVQTLLVLGLGWTHPCLHPHLHRCPQGVGMGKAAHLWLWREQGSCRAASQIPSMCPLQGERGPPGQSVPGARGVPGIPGERGEQVSDGRLALGRRDPAGASIPPPRCLSLGQSRHAGAPWGEGGASHDGKEPG